MTVQSQVVKQIYVGDGVTTNYPIPFKYAALSDLRILWVTAGGVVLVQTYGGSYTVPYPGDTAVFTVPPALGVRVIVKRATAFTQETDYVENDAFPAEAHEKALDKLTFETQELRDMFSRTLLLSEGSTASNLLLPEPDAGKALRWNMLETGLENFIPGIGGGGGTVIVQSGVEYLPYIKNLSFNVTDLTSGGLAVAWPEFEVLLATQESKTVPAGSIALTANSFGRVYIDENGVVQKTEVQGADPLPPFDPNHTRFLSVATGPSVVIRLVFEINGAPVLKRGIGLTHTDTDFRREFLDAIKTGMYAGLPCDFQSVNPAVGRPHDYFNFKYWQFLVTNYPDDAKNMVERFFNTLFCVPWASKGVWSLGGKTTGVMDGSGNSSGFVYTVSGFTDDKDVAAATLYSALEDVVIAGKNTRRATRVTVGTGNYESRLVYVVNSIIDPSLTLKFKDGSNTVTYNYTNIKGYSRNYTASELNSNPLFPNNDIGNPAVPVTYYPYVKPSVDPDAPPPSVIQEAGYFYLCTVGGTPNRAKPKFGAEFITAQGTEDIPDDPNDKSVVLQFERGDIVTGMTGDADSEPVWGDTFVTWGNIEFRLVGEATGRAGLNPPNFGGGADTLLDYTDPDNPDAGGIVWKKQSIYNPNTGGFQSAIYPGHKWYMMIAGAPRDIGGGTFVIDRLQMPDAHDSSAAVAIMACHAVAEQFQGDFYAWFGQKTRLPKNDGTAWSLEELVRKAYYHSIAANFSSGLYPGLTYVFQQNKVPGGGDYAARFLEDNLESWRGLLHYKSVYDYYMRASTVTEIDIVAMRAEIAGNLSYIQSAIPAFRKEIVDAPGKYIHVPEITEPAPTLAELRDKPWYPWGQCNAFLLMNDFPLDPAVKRDVCEYLDEYRPGWYANANIGDFPQIGLGAEYVENGNVPEVAHEIVGALRQAFVAPRNGALSFGDALGIRYFTSRGLRKNINIIRTQTRSLFDFDGKNGIKIRGDGVNNDHRGIQYAINACAENGERLYIPSPGRSGEHFFRFEGPTILLPSNASIEWDDNALFKPAGLFNNGTAVAVAAGASRKNISKVRLYNPQFDGSLIDFYALQTNALAFVSGRNTADPGVWYTCRDVYVEGGFIRNYLANFDISGPGGKAVNFEESEGELIVDGMRIENCAYACLASPTFREPTLKKARNIQFINIQARGCGVVFFIVGDDVRKGVFPITDPAVSSVVCQGTAYNCGHFLDGRRGSSIPSMKDAPVVLMFASNVKVDLKLFNAYGYPSADNPGYGSKFPFGYPPFETGMVGSGYTNGEPIGSLVLGSPGRNNTVHIQYDGDCDEWVRLQNPNSNGNYNAADAIRPRGSWGNVYSVIQRGSTQNILSTGQSALNGVPVVSATSNTVTLPSTYTIGGSGTGYVIPRNNWYTGYSGALLDNAGVLVAEPGAWSGRIVAHSGLTITVSPAFPVGYVPDNTNKFNFGSSRDAVATEDFREFLAEGAIVSSLSSNDDTFNAITNPFAGSASFLDIPKFATDIHGLPVYDAFGVVVQAPASAAAFNGMTLYIDDINSVGNGQSKAVLTGGYDTTKRRVYFATAWGIRPNVHSYFEIRNGSTVVYSGQVVLAGSLVGKVTLPPGTFTNAGLVTSGYLLLPGIPVYYDLAGRQDISVAFGVTLDFMRYDILSADVATQDVFINLDGATSFDQQPGNGAAFKLGNPNFNQVSGDIKGICDVITDAIVHRSVDTRYTNMHFDIKRAHSDGRTLFPGGNGTSIVGDALDIQKNRNSFPMLTWPPLTKGTVTTHTYTPLAGVTAVSFTPKYRRGMVLLRYYNYSSGRTESVQQIYYDTVTGFTELMGASDTIVTADNVQLTSGTGTGTDTKFTVSAYATDGKIYLQNRLGGSVNVIAEDGPLA